MKRKLIIWICGLLLTQSLPAQESRTLTLKEAIELALKNSKQLKNNESKIREALAAVKEAEEKIT